MKNKDGIVIKPKQIWSESVGETEVIGFRKGRVVAHTPHKYDAWGPESSVFMNLIKSHDGADLEQARKDGWEVWVEGMEKPDEKRIETDNLWMWIPRDEDWRQLYSEANIGTARTYRYKLKAEPQEPERLELEILRGTSIDAVLKVINKTVGVNQIPQSFYYSVDYELIGYRYAESDVITCTGPNAWWYGANNRLAVPKSNGYTGNYIPHPVFATHAVYEKVKK